jgi:hypothetical protein
MKFLNSLVTVMLVLMVLVFSLPAQDSPPAVPTLTSLLDKDVMVVLGPSFISGGGTPAIGGTVGASFPLGNTLSGGVFADIAFRTSGNPQINIRGQLAQQIFTFTVANRTFPVSILGDIGPTFVASDPNAVVTGAGKSLVAVLGNIGTNVGYIAATGVQTEVVLPHNIRGQPYFRVVKGSLNDAGWSVGVNFGIPVRLKKVVP